MRTNIEIDDTLMRDALAISGLPTKRAVVEEALRALLRSCAAADLRTLRGKVEFWEDYDQKAMQGNESHELGQ